MNPSRPTICNRKSYTVVVGDSGRWRFGSRGRTYNNRRGDERENGKNNERSRIFRSIEHTVETVRSAKTLRKHHRRGRRGRRRGFGARQTFGPGAKKKVHIKASYNPLALLFRPRNIAPPLSSPARSATTEYIYMCTRTKTNCAWENNIACPARNIVRAVDFLSEAAARLHIHARHV